MKEFPGTTKSLAALVCGVLGGVAGHSGASGKDPLFPSFDGRSGRLSGKPLSRHDALQIVKRRLALAGLSSLFSNHRFRATGITTFLENGGQLETAQTIAGHADSRTTKGYDRRGSKLQMEKIVRVIS